MKNEFILRYNMSFNRFCDVVLNKLKENNIENIIDKLLEYKLSILEVVSSGKRKKRKLKITRDTRMIASLIERIRYMYYNKKFNVQRISQQIEKEQEINNAFK